MNNDIDDYYDEEYQQPDGEEPDICNAWWNPYIGEWTDWSSDTDAYCTGYEDMQLGNKYIDDDDLVFDFEIDIYEHTQNDLVDIDDDIELVVEKKVILFDEKDKTNLEIYDYFISELIKRTTNIKELDLLHRLKHPKYQLSGDEEFNTYLSIIADNLDLEILSRSRLLASKEYDELQKLKTEKQDRSLDIENLLTMEIKHDFIFDGMKPKTVGFMVASGGAGKSRLILQLLCSLSSQCSFNGLFDIKEKQRVSYITCEDDETEVAYRLQSIVKSFNLKNDKGVIESLKSNLKIYSKSGSAPFMYEKGEYNTIKKTNAVKWIENIAYGSRLLVLDPLSHFLGCIDENNSSDVRIFMNELKRIAEMTGCGILVIHHTNKSSTLNGQADLAQSIMGSASLTNTARFQWNLSALNENQLKEYNISESDKGDYKALTVAKSNYIKAESYIILKNVDGVFIKAKIQNRFNNNDVFGDKLQKRNK